MRARFAGTTRVRGTPAASCWLGRRTTTLACEGADGHDTRATVGDRCCRVRRRRGRTGLLHVRRRSRVCVPNERSRGVCELSCHVRALRGVDESEPSCGRDLQRLPHAARPRWEVHREGAKRLLAFLLLHDRRLPGSVENHRAEPNRDRACLPVLPFGDHGGHRSPAVQRQGWLAAVGHAARDIAASCDPGRTADDMRSLPSIRRPLGPMMFFHETCEDAAG